jgi:RNA polymerase sigma-70 factor (ECF subfamily)
MMGAVMSDEERWVRAVYAAHGDELYRFALRLLGDPGLAEETVQDTFVRAWRHVDDFDPARASMRTWLFVICRRVVIDAARARSVRPLAPPTAAPVEIADLAAEVDRVLTTWQLDEALARLTPEHRAAVVEITCKGRSYDDVARELDLPSGTVKSRVYYGLRNLRLSLEELGWNA